MKHQTRNKTRFLAGLLTLALVLAGLFASLPAPQVARAQLDVVHYIPPFYATYTLYLDSRLYLSTPSTTSVNVTVKDGANTSIWSGTISNASPTFVDVATTVLASDSQLNQVQTNGLVVTADAPIYANVRHSVNNQGGSLTAKGLAALGTRFRAGVVRDRDTAVDEAYVGVFISVMATEDGTTVNFDDIKPGVVFYGTSFSGSPATSDPISVVLDANESYVIGIRGSTYAPGTAPFNEVNGTLITSDKPIAVNTGSWLASLVPLVGDMGIDQIVPEDRLALEYILMQGNGGGGDLETPVVVATADNTDIYVNGGGAPFATLQAGDYAFLDGQYLNGNMLVTATLPIYIYQTMAGELNNARTPGMNFIPPLDATSPSSVDNIPSVDWLGDATVNILARNGAGVWVNGSPIGVSPSAVTGTSDWVTYRVTGLSGNVTVMSTAAVAVQFTNVSGKVGAAGYYAGLPLVYRDFGDLPAAYNLTTSDDNGARHATSGLFLGAAVDGEDDGQESANADGDDTNGTDDEDGVTVPGAWTEGADGGVLDVIVTGGSGCLSAWLDWAGDDNFSGANDQILDMVEVTAGTNNITFDVPVGTAGVDYYTRFRLVPDTGLSGDCSDDTPLATTGLASGGEVEDHLLSIEIGGGNEPPTADAGGPYSGDEGSAIALDGATADDPDSDPLTYDWSVNSTLCSFDDPTALNPNLTCSDDGTYQVTLTVTDGVNDPVSDSASVTVDNVPPSVDADNPVVTVDEGDTAFNAGDFFDPGQDDVTFTASIGTVTVQTGSTGSAGIFLDSGQNLGATRSIDVDLGDLDGDGDLDAFVANFDWTTNPPNKVWLNQGGAQGGTPGVFVDSGQNLGSSKSYGVRLGDLDGDGDLDAFVANCFGQANKVWLNDGSGAFSDSGQNLGDRDSVGVALADLDGDLDLDVYVVNEHNQPDQVYLNDGHGIFSDTGQNLGNSASNRVELRDLDGDDDLDAFVACRDNQPNKVWLNDGTGTFADSGQALGSSWSYGVDMGDFDGDGDQDAFVGNWQGQANKVWLNDGTGIFFDSGQDLGNHQSVGIDMGDVDSDGDLDAFVNNYNQGNQVYLNDGVGTFSDSGQSLGSSMSYDVRLGDLDGDGDLDAFVANFSSQADKVWLNQTDPVDGRWSWEFDTDDGPAESQTVTITADDGDPSNNIGTAQFELIVNNVAPTATFTNDGPVDEGSSFNLTLTDPYDPSTADTAAGFEYAFDCGDGAGYSAWSSTNSATCPTDDNGVRSVKGKIRDKDGGVNEYTASVEVNNVAPTIEGLTAPLDPVDIGNQPVSVEVAFSDPGTADTHDVTWDWGDLNSDTQYGTTSPASQGHTYTEAGVYVVTVTVTDDDGGSASQTYEFIVIYDPEGGFVTGGGWIMSPAGAYAADPTLTGKANFGFVSKYKKGASVPTGNTNFQFKAGDLHFHSSSYQWLVIAGARAKYKGVGTINGEGNYGFMLTATDAELTSSTDVDLFRIKIWDRDNGDVVVYDNQMGSDDDGYDGTEIGGGNIKVHTAK